MLNKLKSLFKKPEQPQPIVIEKVHEVQVEKEVEPDIKPVQPKKPRKPRKPTKLNQILTMLPSIHTTMSMNLSLDMQWSLMIPKVRNEFIYIIGQVLMWNMVL